MYVNKAKLLAVIIKTMLSNNVIDWLLRGNCTWKILCYYILLTIWAIDLNKSIDAYSYMTHGISRIMSSFMTCLSVNETIKIEMGQAGWISFANYCIILASSHIETQFLASRMRRNENIADCFHIWTILVIIW